VIEQCARVIAVQSGQAHLLVRKQSACLQCENGTGCGGGIFNRLTPERSYEFSVANTLDAQVDDQITIGITPRSLLLASLLFYLTPIAMMLLTTAWAAFYSAQDLVVVLSAIIGLAAGLMLARRAQRRLLQDLQPKMISRMKDNPATIIVR